MRARDVPPFVYRENRKKAKQSEEGLLEEIKDQDDETEEGRDYRQQNKVHKWLIFIFPALFQGWSVTK